MIGAGIYVLIGSVSAEAGIYAPLSFILAGVIAAPTALSYGELSARIPESGGEAAYVGAAWSSTWPTAMVAVAIILGGSVSAAAVLQGGSGYLSGLLGLPSEITIIVLGVIVTAVAILGIVESLVVAAVFTLAEIGGLAGVFAAGMVAPVSPDWSAGAEIPAIPIAFGAVIAFFAFIGFEDMVNLAEETIDPGRTMPRAILLALALTTLFYAAVAYAAVRAVPLDVLSASSEPLADVVDRAWPGTAGILSVVAVGAAFNGVLAQIVMASRVLLGISRKTPVLAPFATVSARFRTPVPATLLISVFVVVAAFAAPLAALAQITSTVLLIVFMIMNATLLVLKSQPAPDPEFKVPVIVPWIGLMLSGAAIMISLWAGMSHA